MNVSSIGHQKSSTPIGILTSTSHQNAQKNGQSERKRKSQITPSLHQALAELNKRLTTVSSLQAVFASNEPANQIWINVVDKNTGKVIEQLPPTSIRKFLAGQNVRGLLIDQKF